MEPKDEGKRGRPPGQPGPVSKPVKPAGEPGGIPQGKRGPRGEHMDQELEDGALKRRVLGLAEIQMESEQKWLSGSRPGKSNVRRVPRGGPVRGLCRAGSKPARASRGHFLPDRASSLGFEKTRRP